MSDTYAQDWKPINWRGDWAYDPRDELKHRADVARSNGDTWVAVPIKLAAAVAALRECSATFVMTHDEDGELPAPQTIRCRKPEGHLHDHYSGYAHWANAPHRIPVVPTTSDSLPTTHTPQEA